MILNSHRSLLPFVAVCFFLPAIVMANEFIVDIEDSRSPERSPSVILPYAFHTDLLETGVGVVYTKSGAVQPQGGAFMTAYGTTNSSWGVAGGLSRLQMGNSRWIFTTQGILQRNAQQRFYAEMGFGVDDTQGGSNNSGVDDFFQGEGWNLFAQAEFRYVMPIGMGSSGPIHQYNTDNGVLVSGSTSGDWNPFASGRTMFVLKPFYQFRSMVVDDQNTDQFPPFFPVQNGDEIDQISNGLKTFIEYDNRDFSLNPQQGSYQRLEIVRDFGLFNSTNSWTSLEAEYKKYISFGGSQQFRQRVLAFDAWTAYVPTWELTQVGDAVRIDNAPPENMGATLGGIYRLRGYPSGRFSDKAAMYYSAEFRFIPSWDPLRSWPLIRNSSWRWWQWAAFAELGRVAPDWDLSELHEDMKWSAGVSIRAMIGSGIGRMDLATSEESTQLILMIGQPF